MADTFDKIEELCKKYYDDFDDDCSGFVVAVTKDLGITLPQPADTMISTLDATWQQVGTGSDAANLAQTGVLVLVGLKSTDQNQIDGPVRHGHIAIVAPGPLYRAKYPMVWCGGGINGRSKGTKSVGEVWSSALISKDKKKTFGSADRDDVTYYRQPPSK
jgi:hypothetical protein